MLCWTRNLARRLVRIDFIKTFYGYFHVDPLLSNKIKETNVNKAHVPVQDHKIVTGSVANENLK